ncbi:MAG: hypothetical protein WCA46_08640, partial [Actinocatenispora sp.]
TQPPLAAPGSWAAQQVAPDDEPTGATPMLPLADQPTTTAPVLPSRTGRRSAGRPLPSRAERTAFAGEQEPTDRTLQLRPGQSPEPVSAAPVSPAASRHPAPTPPTAPGDEVTAERPTLPGEPEPPKLDFTTDFQPTIVPGEQEAAAEPVIEPLTPPILRSVELNHDEQTASVTPLPPLDQLPRARRGGEAGPRSRRRRSPSPEPRLRPENPPSERRLRPESPPPPQPPVEDEGDSELLIFAAARSAWFAGEHNEMEWDTLADEGWRAAEAASSPSVGTNTDSGLPRRVPQANLVPGSPVPTQERAPIARDASHLAAQTAGYFRGWQRGRHSTGQDSGARGNNSEAFLPVGRR